MAQTKKFDEEEEDQGKCFVAETQAIDAMTSINFERDWIVDSRCGHLLTGDESKFSNFRKYNGHDVIVTTDNTVHQVERKKRSSLISRRKTLSLSMVCSMFQGLGKIYFPLQMPQMQEVISYLDHMM